MEKRIAMKMGYDISKPVELSEDIREIISKNGNQLKTQKDNLAKISTFAMESSLNKIKNYKINYNNLK